MQTTISSSPDRQQQCIDTATMLILIAVLGSVTYTYLQRGVWLGLRASGDFAVFYTASNLVRHGQADLLYDIEWFYNIGMVGPYLYFPFFAIVLYPLSLLTLQQASTVWMIFNQGILIASIWMVATGLSVRDIRIVLGIIILFLGFGPMDMNMYLGQVNPLMMFCVLLTWWAYKNKRPWLCGTAIGLGTVIKIVPAILGVYFLYKREYRVVTWSLLSFFGCVLLSMILLGGYAEYYAWFTDMLPYLQAGYGKSASVINQSFFSLYMRLAQNGFWSASFASRLHLVSEFGICLLSFALFRFVRLRPDALEFDLEFASIVCLIVLMPPVAATPHFVTSFPAFLIVLVYLINHGVRNIPLFICYGIAYTTVSLGAFGSEAFARWPLVLFQSSKLFGSLLLWGMIGYLLLRLRGASATREHVA